MKNQDAAESPHRPSLVGQPPDVVFFDLGDTLGVPVLSVEGRLQRFAAFDFAAEVLAKSQDAGARLGIISNTGDTPGATVNDVLKAAGLLHYFEPGLLVYSKEVGLKKDSTEIFRHAARLAGLENASRKCVFVGEDAAERHHAQAAGWRICPHPMLVGEVIEGQKMRLARVEPPAHLVPGPWRRDLRTFPVVPLHVAGRDGSRVYVMTSERTAGQLINALFSVTLLGEADALLTRELYLLRDDKAKASGYMDTRGSASSLLADSATAGLVLESQDSGILVSLPPEIGLDEIHFDQVQHGHTVRLMPDPHLLDEAGERSHDDSLRTFAAATPIVREDELPVWSGLNQEIIRDRVERYTGAKPLSAADPRRIMSRHVAHPDNKSAVLTLAAELQALAPDHLRVRLHQFSHQGLSLYNVVAEIPGQTSRLVLVTAHVDSIAHPGNPATDAAPGADDDMSGVAAVLAIAERMIQLVAKQGPPESTLQFVLFNDEENGLVGSQSYARQLRSNGADVAGVMQMDMIGYNKDAPRAWEIHFGYTPSREVERLSEPLATAIAAAASSVSPTLPRPQVFGSGQTDPAERRSDHASFHQFGYAACVISEDFFIGPGDDASPSEPNPNYHKAGDLFVDNLYAADIARAVGAGAWAVATGRYHLSEAILSGNRISFRTVMKRELDTRKEHTDLNGRSLGRPTSTSTARADRTAPAAYAAPAVAGSSTLVEKALAFVQSHSFESGLTADHPVEYVPDPTVQRTSAGGAAVHLHQYYRGIPVFEMTRTIRFTPESQIVDGPGSSVRIGDGLKIEPELSAHDALRRAAEHLAATSLELEGDGFGQTTKPAPLELGNFRPETISAFNLPARPTVMSKGPFEQPVPAHLVIFPSQGGARLAWHIVPTFPRYSDQYVVLVSADDRSGEILYCISTAHHMKGRGNVFELSPGLKERTIVPFPRPLSDYPVMPSAPLVGFPPDWIDDGSTSGNSTHATLGDTGRTLAGKVQDGLVTFDPQDGAGDDQKLLNIFYFCNYAHDFLFLLGFDEAAGNFQRRNLTNAGLGGDPVRAFAHSGPVDGVANMLTFPDGRPPVMNMGLFESSNRHTAFDADVVFHEYIHGLTKRLVGGGMNTAAMNEPQSRGMGEGWSDYYALTIVSYTTGRDKIVTGDWVTKRPGGIRRAPYDDRYPTKFGGIGALGGEHQIGEVWCAALMMMTRKIRKALGDRDGYRIGWQIVTDGLKLTPANPSFLDARDAILLALDQLKDIARISAPVHGTVRRACWEAFAHFEMGIHAATDGASLQGVVGDPTLPSDL